VSASRRLRAPGRFAALASLALVACGGSGSGAGGEGGVTATSTGAGGATVTGTGVGGSSGGAGGASSSTSSTSAGGAGGATVTSTGGAAQGGAGQGGALPATRGFRAAGPWVSFYGSADGLDLASLASHFRIFNIDVDPTTDNFTDAEIQALRAGGQNQVISYLDVGSCETYREYYAKAPAGHASCKSSGALTTVYSPDYPDEWWADLSNVAYRDLLVNYVAPRLAARGIDGFFLDNLEVVEHGAKADSGPCDAACAQGGLDLVWELRQRFPDKLIVMQNATSDVTRLGTTHGVPYPSLLDGVSHEEVYSNGGDAEAQAEMKAWQKLALSVNGHPFWLACEEYVGSCDAASKAEANALAKQAEADGLSPYVTDASGAQQAPCVW
jgi:cysteinyl-tRNA synthetase